MPASCVTEIDSTAADILKKLVIEVLQISVKERQFVLPPAPVNIALQQLASSFVSLYVNNQLTGCIGSLQATRPLWQDICHNAYSSAFTDSRFPSLTEENMTQLSFDIAILSTPQPMINQGQEQLFKELVPERDGLILEQGNHQAVFLPAVWHKLSAPRAFVTALKQKAGWREDYWHADIAISRFTTQVIHGAIKS